MSQQPVVFPYVLLASDNYATLTYLEYLKYYGYAFKKIIHVKTKRSAFDFSSKRKVLSEILSQDFKVKIDYDLEHIDYSKYCDDVLSLELSSSYDDYLYKIIEEHQDETLFFSYVGRVPQRFLDLVSFIHIHPGIMPDIRGTDCLFWSLALRQKLGATMFFLNSGIDDGAILYQQEYGMEYPNLNAYGNHQEIYKAILDFLDCHIRSKVLIEAIETKGLEGMIKQSNLPSCDEGRQYFSMHKKLLMNLLNRYFGVEYD